MTGLRIDHIDGLWDPRQYLERLQSRHGGQTGEPPSSLPLYLVVEKILDPFHEALPPDWPVHGTTGYEFANQAVHALIDPSSEALLTRTYREFTGEVEPFEDLVYQNKRLVTEISFHSEITGLGRLADQISEFHRLYRDFTSGALTIALRELISCFPVYRTYVSPSHAPDSQEEREILRAVVLARRRNPSIDKPVFDFLRGLLLKRFPESLTPAQSEECLHFVMEFQQCSGPVMAKGLEDTALYLYHRLIALNEVGGHPGVFGIGLEDFHRFNRERLPGCMLATSTHDTKRSEDVRMRIAAISEVPGPWRRLVRRWNRMNRRHLGKVDGENAPSANEEYLLYQTLLGAWPMESLNEENRQEFVSRIQEYMLKALKEGKTNSSWIQPNEEWEQATMDFIARILNPRISKPFLRAFEPFAGQVALMGAWNSLSQLVLKCTLPGVPDVYQGTELWDLSLVDPDNRRPVDFALRRQYLASLEGMSPGDLVNDWKSGRIKLFVLQRLLCFRRDHAQFFREADYAACASRGDHAESVIGFRRCLDSQELCVLVSRWTSRIGPFPMGELWKESMVEAGEAPGPWRDLLSGRVVDSHDGGFLLREVFADLPFAVLVRKRDGSNPRDA